MPKPRTFTLFILFTVLFLFYPGDTRYYRLFSENRALFESKPVSAQTITNPVPYLRYQSYPPVTAEGIYVVDLPSFTPVFAKDENKTFLPASTTKIITALVATDIYKPDDVITVRRVVEEGQTMGLVINEKITAENLLYGLLIHSGNDAAYALADGFGYDKFVLLMNDKAKTLGMTASHFSNPAGLDDSLQLTTPFDLTLASRALLNDHFLRRIVAIKEITIADVDFKYFHRLSNVNKLLGEIQGIGGLKTGYTENAGENLVSFYKYQEHQYIIVLLKSLDRFDDTKKIVSWIDTNVDYLTP
ncbi:D-alanyl-D-alanine carboxypeptidase [Candidatus Roizmanbacteria bacterium]|nr:D-alanyl-D-alanine carboxypeptidase [Candidatus Roizmanbacteria bacterium]